MIPTLGNNSSRSHLTSSLALSFKDDQSAGYLFPPGEPFSLSKINGCYGLPELNADRNVLEGMARKPTHQQTSPRSTRRGVSGLAEL